MKYSADQIREIASRRLSPKRFEHTVRVAESARRIAERAGVDPERMYVAGLLHDIAKEVGNDEILRLCEKTGRFIPPSEIKDAHSLHGLAGAAIAYEEFGIRDEGILRAIAFHSGRAAMSTEEKILLLADGTDGLYKRGIDTAYIWEQQDLDSALLVLCTGMIKYCVKNGISLGARTQDGFDFLIEHSVASSGPEEEGYLRLRKNTDEIVDKAMEIYLSHRVDISSVGNIRDAGGYRTVSGRMIKRGKLIRSGALSELTGEDAQKLKDMGINCIIDLRTDEEAEEAPDYTDGFIAYHCPLPAMELSDNQKRLSEYANSSIFDDETAWYASQYMQDVDMEKTYQDIILQPASIAQLRRIFEILLDDNTQGVLFHGVNGKDRTGVVAMLIQLVLGMNREEITDDFNASFLPYYRIAENTVMLLEQNGYSSNLSEKVREMFGIDAEPVHHFEKWCRGSNIGTMEDYFTKALMLSQDKRRKLCEKYLDPVQE